MDQPLNMVPTHTLFGLMRHAPTVWNLDKRIQGISDSDLTDDGRRLAERWGRCLAGYAWDRILTSDLGRARHTAGLVNRSLGVPIEAMPALREMDWGQWTGATIKQIRLALGNQLSSMEKDGWQFQPPDGESRNAVWQRASEGLLHATRTWPGRIILVITHEGVIKALLYRLSHREYLPTESPILKRSRLHWIEGRAGALSLKALNAVDLNQPKP